MLVSFIAKPTYLKMLLLFLFPAVLFSVQCAPQIRHDVLDNSVYSQYAHHLLDQVNVYTKYASNFQDGVGEQKRFRRRTDNNTILIPIAISSNFSPDVQKVFRFMLTKVGASTCLKFQEIALNKVETIDSNFVLIINETKENLADCQSTTFRASPKNADKFILTISLNENCMKNKSKDRHLRKKVTPSTEKGIPTLDLINDHLCPLLNMLRPNHSKKL